VNLFGAPASNLAEESELNFPQATLARLKRGIRRWWSCGQVSPV